MISAIDLVKFMRHGKNAIYAHGNHCCDRSVFYYLLDAIDLNTGIAGSVHKLSNGRIADDVSERKVQGKKSVPVVFKSSDVRNSITRLVNYGLFDRFSEKGKGGNLRLRACVEIVRSSDSHDSVSKKVINKLATSYQPKNVINQCTYDDSEAEGLQKVSISIPFHSIPSSSDTVDPSAKLAMHLAWQPSELFKNQISEAWKPSAEMLKQIQIKLMGFKTYWSTRPTVLVTQADWEKKLWTNELSGLLSSGLPARSANVRSIQSGSRKPAPSSVGNPKLLKVPSKLFGEVLQRWAVNNAGFRVFAPGESDDDYREALGQHITRLDSGQSKKSASSRDAELRKNIEGKSA